MTTATKTMKTEPTFDKNDKESVKKYLKYQQAKDKEMVKGIFRFHEVPGGCVSFTYGPMYKGDQTERYDLVDGQVYSLPLGVARHLNKNVWYPVHAYLQDENGNKVAKVGQKVRRCSFQSLEFVDIDDLTPTGTPLVTVETVGL